jgi:hypothetical protein
MECAKKSQENMKREGIVKDPNEDDSEKSMDDEKMGKKTLWDLVIID